MASGDKIVPINQDAKTFLDSDKEEAVEPAIDAYEKIWRYKALAAEAMSALLYYSASDDPDLRARASNAISSVIELTQGPPPKDPPR